MARMSNMVMKPVSWVKKHWVKVVVAIIVIYAIYWLFFDEVDVEGYTTDNVYSKDEINKMKNDYLAVKEAYDAAVRDYNDTTKATYIMRDGVKSDGTALVAADLCYKNTTTTPVSGGYVTQSGCKGFMDNAKATMDAKWKIYAPYAPKKKSSKKKKRRFFFF